MTGTDMIEIKEIYLKPDPGSGYMVILKETAEAPRYFMMFVGEAEFAAIAREKGLLESKRPLTHQLYLSILEKTSLCFKRIEIHDLKDDTFYARVVFETNGEEQSVDSRPSDAVALALNRKIPIMVKQGLFRRKLTQEEIQEYEGIVKTVKF